MTAPTTSPDLLLALDRMAQYARHSRRFTRVWRDHAACAADLRLVLDLVDAALPKGD